MSEISLDDAREVRKLSFDLANYFSNTIVPQLFIDVDLILRIFTPPAMSQLNLSYDHIGRSIYEMKDNIRHAALIENIEEVIATNRNLEKEIQSTDGRWFQMTIVPYIEHEDDQIKGVIVTFIDITRRLNAIKELEKLNADHETLMFALSHDLKQPIAAITLLADALAQAHKKNDSQQFDKWITTLKQSSKSLALLVDEFTTDNENIGKKESSEQKLNIQEICNDVLIALKTEIRSGKIHVIKNFHASEIIFPRNNLRSIVYNLIHNAIKYRDTKKQSRIEITTKKIQDHLVLSIKDNGPGIAEEHQKDIFEKSVRIRKDIKGTGMGLYIAKKMIEANEGKITLESKPGEGSVFRVYFKSELPEQTAEMAH